VADFIFTTCTMACPVMTGNMNIIHKEFRNNNNVRIVSISVYPEYDTPEVLSEFASRYNANTDRWHFLTSSSGPVKKCHRSVLAL
jgi:protein SCO1/2